VSSADRSEAGAATSAVTGPRRQYVKLCDLRDFAEPEVRARIDDIVPGLEPPEHLHRKNWEYAMLTLFLDDFGLLRDDARILSIGAGHETVLFWLANRVAEVIATDIYGEGSFSEHEADRAMLSTPRSFAPYPYRESHLEVRHMDARKLEFPDGSFDAVFSLSSIEHFGSWADIRRSVAEIGRVLRPGGGAFIATECFLGPSVLSPLIVQEAGSRVTRGRMFGAFRIFTPGRSFPRSSRRAASTCCNPRYHPSRHHRQRDRAARARADHVDDRERVSLRRRAREAIWVSHAEMDIRSARDVQAVSLVPARIQGRC
jgi:SAM-dependent methyltransferase